MKKLIIFTLLLSSLSPNLFSKNDLYEKIDLFGEVLVNIKRY